MISDKGILIKNIYYMLSYAFSTLKQSNYEEIEQEDFEHIHDLLAAVLAKGIAQELKQGLHREYIPLHEELPIKRGKIDFPGTIKLGMQQKKLLSCRFEELSVDNQFNRVLKTTADILLRQASISSKQALALRRILQYMGEIGLVADPLGIAWNRMSYHRSNERYRMLMNICFFILNGLLLSTEQGKYKVASFLDEQSMSRLFERFVLEYYRKHHPQLRPNAPQIRWLLDDGAVGDLPVMQSDITLHQDQKALIIDTKYYSRAMQHHAQYGKRTIHSGNLYQIFTYVKNRDHNHDGSVSGMLLYAKTDEEVAPNGDFLMSGNRISVRTLDLGLAFSQIAHQLDAFAMQGLA